MTGSGQPAVLVVDDSADKRLALEAVLADLSVRVVAVASGREALRRLLHEDFAVILLDVRMPDIDGFETAALIRSRPRSERTPIIFVTAFGDETHEARGYSLKAVDYLMAPISPEVLRTKVSVLVDLFSMTMRVQQQAESLQRRATQLHRLTAASIAVNASASFERMARLVADAARDITGALEAMVVLNAEERRTYRATSSAPHAAGGGAWPSLPPPALVGEPAPPGTLRAWLTGNDGRPLGRIEVSRPPDGGSFDESDEDLLLQLGQIAAIAVENALSLEAREANRLKDEFLATVSHELRTPLSAILSWTEILRRGGPAGPAAGRALEAIDRNARAQARLVDDLLDVSRIVTGKLRLEARLVEFDVVVRGAADAVLGSAATKGVTVTTRLEVQPVHLLGDPDRLQQVVTNLLGNAVKFTPSGGRVDVVLSVEGLEAVLRVRDTGVGIPAEFLPYVFDRFRQVDGSARRRAGGLGLGLAIVRHLIELHDGSVEAESAGEGRGSTFLVRLPLAPGNHQRLVDQDADTVTIADLHGMAVLVVEDEPDIRDALCLTVSEAGARVCAVATAAEALAALAGGRPDVLVCDIGLPFEDGYVLLDKVRGLPGGIGRDLPAIALTAYARPDDRRAALAAGFQAHLAKPVEPDTLLRTLAMHAAAARREARHTTPRLPFEPRSHGDDETVRGTASSHPHGPPSSRRNA